ncbi:unnamed protein product [Caenorhabditis brenneri]
MISAVSSKSHLETERMGLSLCSRGNYEKSALIVGIWSLFSSIAHLIFMSWQMTDTNDRSARATIKMGGIYDPFGIPDKTFIVKVDQFSPDASLYRALYITQSICITADLFLIISSVLFILAVCKQKKLFIFPWFPCMLFSVFATVGNCFALWSGYNRVPCMDITVFQVPLVLVDVYCVGIMTMYCCQTDSNLNRREEINGNENREDGIEDSRNYECQFKLSSCFCCNSSNATLTVAMWSFVYGILSFLLFGWQTNVMIHCRFLISSMDRFHCVWECPCVEEVKKQTAVFIDVIFLFQIICLISYFLLIIASCAMMLGVSSKSETLIIPWFACMISSMFASLIYCILWWCGDVRDYWTAITVVLTIESIINIYCVAVVIQYYGDLTSASKKRIPLEEQQNLENLLKSDDKNTCSTPPPEYHLVAESNAVCPQYTNQLISLEN